MSVTAKAASDFWDEEKPIFHGFLACGVPFDNEVEVDWVFYQ